MRVSTCLSSLCLTGLLLSAPTVWAQPKTGDAPSSQSDESGDKKEGAKKKEPVRPAGTIPDAKEKPILTMNTVTIAGQRITYVAETGMLPLLKPDGTLRASIFYVAYTKQGETSMEQRPVTFCFNGGPGSSSVWLHLGALGPRRAKLSEPGAARPGPLGLVDNEFSILHVTDLVFIDPVATGFSRSAADAKAEQFFGKTSDIESVGEFIRLWTTRHQRWLSPKYVCGESYGVFRAAGLAHELHTRYAMSLSGLIFVSGLLDYAALSGDLGCQVSLPALTATAHFHKKLPPDLQADLPKALAEAREFMRTKYAVALFQGASLTADERGAVVTKLSRLTGLPPRVIEENNLRVRNTTFRKELLKDQRLILGRYDARITGRDPSASSDYSYSGFDPSLSNIDGAFSAAMNAYVRSELKFEDDLPYDILLRAGDRMWSFEPREGFPSVTQEFASEMKESPHLRVLVLSGRCDLACPVDGIRYSIDHLNLDPAYRGHITYAEYESGHMMYTNPPDLRKMQKDLAQFLQAR
jgi:carboxypeptidase C (cathepsin A)